MNGQLYVSRLIKERGCGEDRPCLYNQQSSFAGGISLSATALVAISTADWNWLTSESMYPSRSTSFPSEDACSTCLRVRLTIVLQNQVPE